MGGGGRVLSMRWIKARSQAGSEGLERGGFFKKKEKRRAGSFPPRRW